MPLDGPDDEWEDAEDSGNPPSDYLQDRVIGERKDPETGMYPVLIEVPPEKTPPIPPARGRQVGDKALALLSRMPLVGLKWLRSSSEFVVYDNQPPPSGEYAVQALGVTTIEYDGIKQNHLLVTFKAGQLTGFGMEDSYLSYETTFGSIVTDEWIDIQTLLGVRNGRAVALFVSRDVRIRFNSDTDPEITVKANQCPFVIDLGLNIVSMYISTIKAPTKLKVVGW